MLTKNLEVSRFTTQTIPARNLRVSIDFAGDDIGNVHVRVQNDEGNFVSLFEMPAELIERIAAVVREARRYSEFRGPAATKEVCPFHGYVEPTKKTCSCSVCEPEKAEAEAQPRLAAVAAVPADMDF